MQFAQLSDRIDSAGSSGALTDTALLGVWINSNPDTNGIERMVMSEADGKLSLQVFAVGPEGLIDWGSSTVKVFASQPASRAGAGFTCTFDFGFAETELQGMIMKGLLVLAQFHRFKDDSKRVDFFVREYYALGELTTETPRHGEDGSGRNALQFKEQGHLDPALLDPATVSNAGKLLGRWVNTNSETRGIAECEIRRNGDLFTIRLRGVGAEGLIEWPIVQTKALANLEEEAGQRTIALAARFEFGFMKSEIYIRVNKGVLVIVLFNTFQDESGRSNYLNREFFYRVSP